jgi:H+/Cl- antiporter ClcA
MDATATGGFLRFFSDLPDPRTGNFVPHKLHDMLVIAILGVICGADGWVEVQLWGRCRHKWLATFLDLHSGIPSHDTFGRVFAMLDPPGLRTLLPGMDGGGGGTVGRQAGID